MARLNIELPDDLMIEFRKKVLDMKGTLRGGMSDALQEAMHDWIQKTHPQRS